MRRSLHRAIAASEFTVLAGIAAAPAIGRVSAVVVLGVGAVAVVAGVAVLMWRAATRRRPSPAAMLPAALAALSALGLCGAVAYLRSLPEASIPLVGVGVALLSLIGMLATGVVLWRHHDYQLPGPAAPNFTR